MNAPDLIQAISFLDLLDPEAVFTFQVFDDSPLKRGHLAKVAHGTLDEEAERLAAWQRAGAGVFVAVNETDGCGRKAENVVRVRAVFADLDGAPLQPVLACRLEPHVVVESSPGRYHAYWLVDDLPPDQFGPVQKAIAARFGGDPSVTDLPRVMRVPGFWHLKGEPFRTRVHGVSDRLPYTAAQILAEFSAVSPQTNGAEDLRDQFGWFDLEAAVKVAAQPGNWHRAVRDAVASMVARGTPDDAIHLACRAFTQPGYTHEQTRVDVQKMIDGARGKGWGGAASPESADWPAPLEPAAWHGLAGEIVRAIEPHSEADPVSLLLQLLAAFGNACGRSHYVAIEGDRHPPQLWPLLVGDTSKARKGTSSGRVRQLFDLAAPYWTAECALPGGLSSGEGVLWHVRDPLLRRDKDGAEEVVDEGAADKRLYVTESEFASVLRHMERAGNNLSGTLRCLWDRGDVRVMTKGSPTRTTGAMVTVVGHVTADELRRYLTRTEMANGWRTGFSSPACAAPGCCRSVAAK